MSSYVLGSFARRVAFAAVGLSMLLAQVPARAEAIYSNSFDPLSESKNTVSGSTSFATGFTTGTATLPLVSIDLAIAVPLGTVNPTVQLFGASGNLPTGAPLATLTTLSAVTGTGQQVYTFTPTSAFNFAPTTTYFLSVAAAGGDSFQWFQSGANPSAQNGSGWTYVAGARSTDGGASYQPNGGGGLGYISVVPEPSTLALAGIGVAMIVGLEARRRTRRREG